MSKVQASQISSSFAIRLKTLSFKTPKLVYALHRFLFRLTDGGWNGLFSQIVSVLNGKYASLERRSEIFSLGEADVTSVVAAMRETGYCTFRQRLPTDMVDRLVEFSKRTPVKPILPSADYAKDGIQTSKEEFRYEEVVNKFARCPHPSHYLLVNKDIHRLMTDPGLLSIAQEYIGSKPILSSVEMWWSFPVTNSEKFASSAAQQYHFDMDHVKFFNVFIYLTDVHDENGPHCFVRSTHRTLPKIFRKRGRFQDADVARLYPADEIVEIKGPRGTVSAVDTRGLHKGKILTRDSRLILQLHFTNSLFGRQYPQPKVSNVEPAALAFMQQHRETFFHYF